MYFYHGQKHYFLTQIFLNDNELRDSLYANGLSGNYEQFAYALADKLLEKSYFEEFVEDQELSANEYYDQEYKNYQKSQGYSSGVLVGIQEVISSVFEKLRVWYQRGNKDLYVAILKSILYGSVKHFFYENREKYLPQYDWYIINNNPKRKDIMDMLFREFDKLSEIADSFQYYQDVDDIPLEFLIYLQEITGLSLNNYNNIFTEKQLRSLTKHLMEVWREKGSLFSIELFFCCMGIQCTARELWFDRRLYDNPNNFNDYTKVQSIRSFGYYLTPQKPHTTSYEFSPESVSYNMYTDPKSSRIWEYKVSRSIGTEEVLKLLGREPGEDITYTYFKSNYILINFSYLEENRAVSRDELNVYKELINYMLPVFVRTYFGNEYEQAYGNDDWDIFNGKDGSTTVEDLINKKTRAATPLGLVDTQVLNFGTDLAPIYVPDAYPPNIVGTTFTSGSYIIFNDTRFTQYITNNNLIESLPEGDIPEKTVFLGNFHNYKAVNGNRVFIIDEDDTVYYDIALVEGNKYEVNLGDKFDYVYPVCIDTIDELLTAPEYDVIGGSIIGAQDRYNCSPVFFSKGQKWHEYRYKLTLSEDVSVVEGKDYYAYNLNTFSYELVEEPTDEGLEQHLYYEIDRTKLIRDDGTEGDLEISVTSDASYPTTENTLTSYYFKVNGSSTRIYTCLFIESNDKSVIETREGKYDETFNSALESQVNWTYDIKSTQEVENLPYETFDQKYTEKALNLFESSSYYDEAFAVNDLYNDDDSWNGNIQYEYAQYTNPLEYVESDLNGTLNITLI